MGEFDALEARLWRILGPTFNFSANDEELFAELETLTARCFETYMKEAD